MRDRGISRNWRERTALPPRVQMDAARTTCVVWDSQLAPGCYNT